MPWTSLIGLAAFIDGEGTVTANLRLGSKHEAVHYRLVPNTHLGVLEELQAVWGGRLSLYTKPRKPQHKPRVRHLLGRPPVLEAVLPHIVIKRCQAELVLLLSTLAVPQELKRAGVGPEAQVRRLEAVAEIVRLNHRGVA